MTRNMNHFIKQKALSLGFSKIGIAGVQKLSRSSFLKKWIAQGKHGKMNWMEKHLDKRMDIKLLFPKAKSVIVVGLNYYSQEQHSNNPMDAKISRYAWGKDYHKILKQRLKKLLLQIQKENSRVEGRICVDTAPIQDKMWAAKAGIGWQGKNTNIISRDFGSWLFLGELILNIDLDYDEPIEDYCGSCSACIDACPTSALVPYKLDAEKCISYMTIEMWDEPIPKEHKSKLKNWVFGCDICQDVCPWNSFQQQTETAEFKPVEKNINPKIDDLLELSEQEFNKRFKKTPVYRAKYKNFIRNVRTIKENS